MDCVNLPPCEMDIVIPTPLPPGSADNSRRGRDPDLSNNSRKHVSMTNNIPFKPPVELNNNNNSMSRNVVKPEGDPDDIFVDCRTTSDGTDLNGDCSNDEERLKLNLNSSVDGQEPHLGATRQYWRDIILGVNDGLVSTFLLVAGVAGGGLSSADILLTAIAGGIAGSVSMCAGEYVATKSQNEVLQGEITLEKHHIEHYRDQELAELHDHLEIIGINPRENRELTDRLVDFYREDADALLKVMTALEFGVVDTEERSPLKAGLFSCILFAAGSLPSVFPFIFMEPLPGLIAAATGTTAALLCVGAIKTWATRGHWLAAAMENLFIAGFGGAFAYFVGAFFDKIVHTTADTVPFIP